MTDSHDYSVPAASISGGELPPREMPLGDLPVRGMPLLGLGTSAVEDADADRAIAEALEIGYRHIDTARIYRNEAGIGRALAASALPRDEIFVTTKLMPSGVGRERELIEESLSKLGIDAVDLWLVHSPPTGSDLVSMWEAFIEAQRDGLATAIGVSNFSLEQLDTVTDATGVTPAVDQVRWSPAVYDPAFASGLADRGVVLEGYSPFKAGDLTDATLASVAREHDATPAQVIVAWHIAHGFVVIPKSSRRERMVENARGTALALSADEVTAIDGLGRG